MSKSSRPTKKWAPPKDPDKSVIFVRSELDEYGLDVYEFRILGHVARREGGKDKQTGKKKGCFARQKNIAEVCGMSPRRAQEALRVLCAAGLLEKETPQPGGTNTYRIASPDKWKHPEELATIRRKGKGLKNPSLVEQSVLEDVLDTEASA